MEEAKLKNLENRLARMEANGREPSHPVEHFALTNDGFAKICGSTMARLEAELAEAEMQLAAKRAAYQAGKQVYEALESSCKDVLKSRSNSAAVER